MFNSIIQQNHLNKIVDLFPDRKINNIGRSKIDKFYLVQHIIAVLVLGMPWHKLDQTYCSYSTSYRYFIELQRRGFFKQTFKHSVKPLIDKSICSIDSTTCTSFHFKDHAKWDGKNKKIGTKISLIIDKNIIPFDVEIDSGNVSDISLLDKHIGNKVLKSNSELNLDKGYTSLSRRRELKRKRIRVNMEYKKNDYRHKRGPKHRLKREIYEKRIDIERFFSWLKSKRRISDRRDRCLKVFKAFVYLAVIVIIVEKVCFETCSQNAKPNLDVGCGPFIFEDGEFDIELVYYVYIDEKRRP